MGKRVRNARTVAGGLTLATCALTLMAGPASAAPTSPFANTPPVITTFAGTGQFGFSGDGGAATQAKLAVPTGTVEDAAGNIYFDDTANNRIRKISTLGIISTVAGTGTFGFGGDGGPAKNAKLAAPAGVAIDGSGNLYIADTGNNRIRKVTAAGTISTIAGKGGFCSLTGNGGPATNATFCLPSGIGVDGSGNLYIADAGNNEVRKVAAGTITAFAGTGAAGSTGDNGPASQAKLNVPAGVSLDSGHNVYISDSGNNKIRKVNTAGIITTFAGTGRSAFGGDGGKAVLGQLDDPTGVGIDSLGNVYISDTGNCRIRVVIPKGDIFTYAGNGSCGYSGDNGSATSAKINLPLGSIAVDANNIYFGDSGNERVRRVHGGPPPNIAEVPFAAVLPLSALTLMGAGWLVTRRRHGARRNLKAAT